MKKSARQKKILSSVVINHEHEGSFKSVEASQKINEEAIVRQFKRIQKGYLLLMNEVAKEFNLVRGWLEKQAGEKSATLKARLSSKIPRMN